jgi:transposase-like protein
MPWRELSIMDQREKFVRLALAPGANRSELCRRFGIGRDKGYKWLKRYRTEAAAVLPAAADAVAAETARRMGEAREPGKVVRLHAG